MKNTNQMGGQGVLFEERFLEMHTGKALLKNPVIAIVELVANAWDSGATRVDITWPDEDNKDLRVEDNGEGMTEQEFLSRWRTLNYDRLTEQGATTVICGHTDMPKRTTFGRNGIGRFAGFCFANQYEVSTSKKGDEITYIISRGKHTSPFELKRVKSRKWAETGTKIIAQCVNNVSFTSNQIKSEIGTRFLIDPNFEVYVNLAKIEFTDLPKDRIKDFTVTTKYGDVKILLIDAKSTDRDTKQHGIAWRINGRLVGDWGWSGTEHEALIDGRRIEAKRYTFIIFADCLASAVKPDWTGFDTSDELYKEVFPVVNEKIQSLLLQLTQEKRDETTANLKRSAAPMLREMGYTGRDKWNKFIRIAQEKCPSLAEKELITLSGVLANLELADSKYELISQLHKLNPDDLDNLHGILKDWTVETAKIVLDELKWRLKFIDELIAKTTSENVKEVQELQPLFEKGLWVFGPEFESIHFTSNQGMTKVIQQLFGENQKGSKNRPDFAILTDGSVGLYACPDFDKEFAEDGVRQLCIVELKIPKVIISSKEKDQCWKYVKEFLDKGLIKKTTKVICFVLGSNVDPSEMDPRTQGQTEIKPMTYDTVLARAKSRTLTLYEKVKSSAPCLNDMDEELIIEDSGQAVEKSETVGKK